MCRLVGWVSAEPVSAADVLGGVGLSELTRLSHQHADGWGMAWWDGPRLRTTSSHLPAHSSPEFVRATRDVRADSGLLHLRWATPGLAVSPENTHPFQVGDWAFGHNGAVRPADGLLDLLTPAQVECLVGDTDSERLLHVLLARVEALGLAEGLRRTVADVSRDLTPSSLNALLLGRDELTAVCCHGLPGEGEGQVSQGPPEDQPGYFDLRWRHEGDAVVIASERLGGQRWERLANGTALVVDRGTARARTVPIGTLSAQALDRERDRRESAAASGAS